VEGRQPSQRGLRDAIALVVIPAFNEAECIGDTLESLTVAARSVKAGGADVEILVVDNASTDRTAALAAGVARAVHESVDPRFT
jgi:glycosyltransferase involved in cell wall biosynthesis